MNENLNLIELLKDVPSGTEFYCTNFGNVKFCGVCEEEVYPIKFFDIHKIIRNVTIKGKGYKGYSDTECIFFPSKTQRDWSVWAKEQEEAKKQLLPINTPVVVWEGANTCAWSIKYYAGNNRCCNTRFNTERTTEWNIIIPFSKFDPNNLEESLKHNIVK